MHGKFFRVDHLFRTNFRETYSNHFSDDFCLLSQVLQFSRDFIHVQLTHTITRVGTSQWKFIFIKFTSWTTNHSSFPSMFTQDLHFRHNLNCFTILNLWWHLGLNLGHQGKRPVYSPQHYWHHSTPGTRDTPGPGTRDTPGPLCGMCRESRDTLW